MCGRSLVTLLAVASLSAACTREEPVSPAIAAAVKRGPGTPLVLGELAGFAWDRVCIFGPYTQEAQVDALTGIKGAAGQAHGIVSSDTINVLMFINQGRIAASIAHPRSDGDFGPELVGKCYTRDQAIFAVRVPPVGGGWGNIGPRGGL